MSDTTSGTLPSFDDNGNISMAATQQPSQRSTEATLPMNHHHLSSSQAPASASTNTTAPTMTMTETVYPTSDEVLMLSLRGRPSVTWDENVVDNEGMGRKSSKRCCIFHKQRGFGESSTDSSDYDTDCSGSSNTSGAGGGDDKDDNKSRRNKKIARKKKAASSKKKVPDFQRYHA